MAPSPSYLTYLGQGESLFIVAARWTTFVLISRLLYRIRFHPQSLRVSQFSLAMYTYLGSHIFGAIVSTPYYLYRIFWWQWPSNRTPGVGLYNINLMFWLGLWDMAYTICYPIPVLFLTLDRICALKPTTWIGLHKQMISKLGIAFAMMAFVSVFILWCVQELPLNLAAVELCELAPCLMTKSLSVPELGIKLTFGTTNLVSSILFLLMLRMAATSNIGGQIAVANRMVKFSIASELLLDLVPTYSGFVFNQLTGISGSTYLGNYVSVAVASEAVIVSIYYWHKMTEKSKLKKTNEEKTAGVELKTNGVIQLHLSGGQHPINNNNHPMIVIQKPTTITKQNTALIQQINNKNGNNKNLHAPIRVRFRKN